MEDVWFVSTIMVPWPVEHVAFWLEHRWLTRHGSWFSEPYVIQRTESDTLYLTFQRDDEVGPYDAADDPWMWTFYARPDPVIYRDKLYKKHPDWGGWRVGEVAGDQAFADEGDYGGAIRMCACGDETEVELSFGPKYAQTVQALVAALQARAPASRVIDEEKRVHDEIEENIMRRRRGGREDTPDEVKLQWVLRCEKRAGTLSKEHWCQNEGVAVSTINLWRRQLEIKGVLPAG